MGSVLKGFAAALAIVASLSAAPAGAQSAERIEAGALQFEQLSPQRLAPGRCGMFLWAQAGRPVLILAAFDQPATAVVQTGGRQRSFERASFSGNPIHGMFERQSYEGGGGVTLEVDVELDTERAMRDGALIKEGVVRVRDREGWETVVPIGGMVACKTT